MQKRIKTAANEQSLELEPGERTMQSHLASFSNSAPGGHRQTSWTCGNSLIFVLCVSVHPLISQI